MNTATRVQILDLTDCISHSTNTRAEGLVNMIIIITMTRHQHGSPWSSLATRLYRPSLPSSLQANILYRHRAVVYILLVLLGIVPNTGFTGLNNIYIYIYIYIYHLVMTSSRISLALSRHPFLSFIASGRSSGLHPISSQSCCM